MIARTWHGVVFESKSDEYLEYLNKTGVPDSQSTEGNEGVFVLRRTEDRKTHSEQNWKMILNNLKQLLEN